MESRLERALDEWLHTGSDTTASRILDHVLPVRRARLESRGEKFGGSVKKSGGKEETRKQRRDARGRTDLSQLQSGGIGRSRERVRLRRKPSSRAHPSS